MLTERRKMITFKEARESAGINSEATMARLMNMSPQLYGLKENYQRNFKDYELMKFCKLTNVKPSELVIKEPTIINIIESDKRSGSIIPTFSLNFLCILLKAILEITLTIRETQRITPIINAVFSTSKFINNSCCINNFPFDCPEFTIG